MCSAYIIFLIIFVGTLSLKSRKIKETELIETALTLTVTRPKLMEQPVLKTVVTFSNQPKVSVTTNNFHDLNTLKLIFIFAPLAYRFRPVGSGVGAGLYRLKGQGWLQMGFGLVAFISYGLFCMVSLLILHQGRI